MEYIQKSLCTSCGNIEGEIQTCSKCGCDTFYIKVVPADEKEVKKVPDKKPDKKKTP